MQYFDIEQLHIAAASMTETLKCSGRFSA